MSTTRLSFLPNPRHPKHILLVATIFNLFSAMNYWINTGMGEWAAGACEFQSVVMQLFEATSSWVWTSMLSFEIARMVLRPLNSQLASQARTPRLQSGPWALLPQVGQLL